MSVIDEMLQTNEKFCANLPEEYKAYEHEDHHDSKLPKKHLAIVTCMDTRLVNFLEPALGIKRGDAKRYDGSQPAGLHLRIGRSGSRDYRTPRMRHGEDDFQEPHDGHVGTRHFTRRD